MVLVEWWLAEGSPSRRTYPFLKANKISERLVLSSTPKMERWTPLPSTLLEP